MVPVGGGSGAAGACVVAKAVRPSIEVIGVQSEAAPAAYRSWQAGSLVEDTTSTFAEGLATRTAFELPQRILWELLDDFVLVSEDALKTATRVMIEKTRNLVEPAGAAALAAVLAAPERFAGRKVAVVCSGGNISPAQLMALWPRTRRPEHMRSGQARPAQPAALASSSSARVTASGSTTWCRCSPGVDRTGQPRRRASSACPS